MKDPMKKTLALLFCTAIGLTPILIILALRVPKWIFNDDLRAQENLINILLCVAIAIVFSIGALISIRGWRAEKKSWKLQEESAKEKLTSEFQKVNLKFSRSIKEELFECHAKIDDDGKIVCRIHLDYEEKLANYEEFTQFFGFDEE